MGAGTVARVGRLEGVATKEDMVGASAVLGQMAVVMVVAIQAASWVVRVGGSAEMAVDGGKVKKVECEDMVAKLVAAMGRDTVVAPKVALVATLEVLVVVTV